LHQVSSQPPCTLQQAADLQAEDVLARLSSASGGLTSSEAARRLATYGTNALHARTPGLLGVLGRHGFATLPLSFLGVIAALMVLYILLVETAKSWFFRDVALRLPPSRSSSAQRDRRLLRRGA
jgi:hypothetical protein